VGLGIAVWKQGDARRSVQLIEQSLKLTKQVRSPRVAAGCLEALAWISFEGRDALRAAVLMGAADGLARSIGSTAIIHSNLIRYQQEFAEKARKEFGDKAFGAAHRKGEQLGFDAAIAYALHEQPSATSTPTADASTRLTKRERQVADLTAGGLTNQAIADRLVISPRTRARRAHPGQTGLHLPDPGRGLGRGAGARLGSRSPAAISEMLLVEGDQLVEGDLDRLGLVVEVVVGEALGDNEFLILGCCAPNDFQAVAVRAECSRNLHRAFGHGCSSVAIN
jgi:DNA-binding NarL/FixJ family response regulator